MIKVNLLGESLAQAATKKPEKTEPQAEQVYVQDQAGNRSTIPIAGLIVSLGFAAIGGVYYLYLNHQVEAADKKKAELEVQKKELEKYSEMFNRYQTQKEMLKKKLDVIRKIKSRQAFTVKAMEQIANAIPDDVWFNDFYINGNSVTISGFGSSFEAINIFRSNLTDNSKWFARVNHQGSSKVGSQVVNFTITFDLIEELT